MERLTFDGNFCDIAKCSEVPGGSFCEDGSCSQKIVWERLKAYEDTGLEPEAVETVKLALCAKHMVDLETLNNTPISRLVELAEADKDGRVVVLPCKIGDEAWYVDTLDNPRVVHGKVDGFMLFLSAESFSVVLVFEHTRFTGTFGKKVFLTREEAEKALREMQRKEDANGTDDKPK